MNPQDSSFESLLDEANRTILGSLTTPWDIQCYLDSLPYVGEELNRSPLRVMQDRQCLLSGRRHAGRPVPASSGLSGPHPGPGPRTGYR